MSEKKTNDDAGKVEDEARAWLVEHLDSTKITQAQLARRLGYSTSSIVSKFIKSKYDPDPGRLLAAIADYREQFEARQSFGGVEFVETVTTRRIVQACAHARATQSVAMIFGDGQVGKTTTLEHFVTEAATSKVRLYRMTTAPSLFSMLDTMLEQWGIDTASLDFNTLRRTVVGLFGPDSLLIVDEVSLVFNTAPRKDAIRCIEFLRELHDRSGCGLVLCSTNVLRDQVAEGAFAKILSQTSRRGTVKLSLKTKAPPADVRAIVAAYGLPALVKGTDEAEVVDEIVSTSGVGVLFKALNNGRALAANAGAAFDWPAVCRAYYILKAASEGGQ